MNKIAPIFLVFFWFCLKGQQLVQFKTFSGSGRVLGLESTILSQNQTLMNIQFEESLELDSKQLLAAGVEDAALVNYNWQQDKVDWVFQISSPLKDNIDAISVDNESGNIFLGGAFGLELNIDQFQIKPMLNPRGLFVSKLDEMGSPQWLNLMDGNGIKEITQIRNSNGNTWVGGYFGDTLQIGQQRWVAMGAIDAFVVIFDKDGALENFFHWGTQGATRIRVMKESPQNDWVIAGEFDDVLAINGDTIRANTNDEDIFLIKLDQEGAVKWLKKAGGVFDEYVGDLTFIGEGQFLLYGDLVGVMTISETQSIQSKTGDPDLFIVEYNLEDGRPINAKTINNTTLQKAGKLRLLGDKIWIGGIYLNPWEWGEAKMEGTENIASFLIELDSALNPESYIDFTSIGGRVFLEGFDAVQENLQVFGTANGDIYINGEEQSFVQNNSAVFVNFKISQATTSSKEALKGESLYVYPNPVVDQLNINSKFEIDSVYLFNLNGVKIKSWKQIKQMDVSRLPRGAYQLTIYTRRGKYNQTIIKVNP